LNVLLVNPVHPHTPHISAVRAWRFAQELSILGHRVALLTAPLRGRRVCVTSSLATHDWKTPYVVVVDDAQQSSRLPTLLRKIRTAWGLAVEGGLRRRWIRNGIATIDIELQGFRPDIVWCTFGAMEAVFAARGISRQTGCPWVLDIKDDWDLYVPSGMRRLMVWRTRGWSAITTNSELTACKARRWQRTASTLIYSGVDDVFFDAAAETDTINAQFTVTLVGGLYFPELVDVMLEGIHEWSTKLPLLQRSQLVVRYLGCDNSIFMAAAARCIPELQVDCPGYVPLRDFARHCRNSVVNMYVAFPGLFHHKLLELVACQRPILVCSAESDEAKRLVNVAGGQLMEAATSNEVSHVLATVCFQSPEPAAGETRPPQRQFFSWPDQTRHLEQVLMATISENTCK
jgi:hypothetical protein